MSSTIYVLKTAFFGCRKTIKKDYSGIQNLNIQKYSRTTVFNHQICANSRIIFAAGIIITVCSMLSAENPNAARIRKDDVNQDGIVTREEFKGPPAIFEKIDQNHDGSLSEDEIAGRPSDPNERNRITPDTSGKNQGKAMGDPFNQNGRKAVSAKIPENIEYVQNVQYGTGGGKPLLLDYIRPRQSVKKLPVIIFVHGGGWQSGSKETAIFTQLMPYAEDGYFCASINYRLSGEAVFPAQIEDCKCAVRFIRAKAKELGLNADRIGAWGSSAGGHLVNLLGTTADIKNLEGTGGYAEFSSRVIAVADWFGPTDLSISYPGHLTAGSPEGKLIGEGFPGDQAKTERANPLHYITKDDAAFIILHGDADTVVPPKMSELFYAALKARGVDAAYRLFPGEKHGSFRNPAASEMTKAFFDRILKVK
ncbi:MAG TPA: calcium sensor EFh [Spirochaetia bacterium]|nr:calcium sensor EFh [Spirochaetia bacterium]